MSETHPVVFLADEYLEAARELVDIDRQEKVLAQRKDAAKAIIAKVLAEGERGLSPDGEPLVTVRPGATRFDPAKATESLPAGLLESISVTAPDAKRAKAVLAPALYDLCCTRNRASIVVL